MMRNWQSVAPKRISPCLPRAKVIASVTEDIDMSKPSDLVQGTLDMWFWRVPDAAAPFGQIIVDFIR